MVEVKSPAPELLELIHEHQQQACEHLELDGATAPLTLVTRINQYLNDLKANGAELEGDMVIALGLLVGEQFVRAFDWHWGLVCMDGNEDYIRTCVLPPDDSLSINPIGWVADILGCLTEPEAEDDTAASTEPDDADQNDAELNAADLNAAEQDVPYAADTGYLDQLAQQGVAGRDCNVLLTFNMVAAGNLPPSAPGQATVFNF